MSKAPHLWCPKVHSPPTSPIQTSGEGDLDDTAGVLVPCPWFGAAEIGPVGLVLGETVVGMGNS